MSEIKLQAFQVQVLLWNSWKWVMISMAGVWQGGSATKFELIVCRFSCPFEAEEGVLDSKWDWEKRNNKMDRREMNEDLPQAGEHRKLRNAIPKGQ